MGQSFPVSLARDFPKSSGLWHSYFCREWWLPYPEKDRQSLLVSLFAGNCPKQAEVGFGGEWTGLVK
jgi:hypothetical protein